MRISREKLLAEANVTGFRPEVVEKVIHLLNLLEGFQTHPYLKSKLALKGGTALNLFFFDLPRLSVDIDLNYIGATGLEEMNAERPRVEQAIQAVCSREGYSISRLPEDHAGGKWRLRYESALSDSGNLEMDLNYMYRIPLWPVVSRNSHAIGSYKAIGIPVLDVHELAAGKLVALFARSASRDLFDARLLFNQGNLDPAKLRLGFVLYGAMNRKDWRTVGLDDLKSDIREIQRQLIPVIRKDFREAFGNPREWAANLLDECRRNIEGLLPLSAQEMDFLDRLLRCGEIEPSLLTLDGEMAGRIKVHPLLQWKAMNVRQYTKKRDD